MKNHLTIRLAIGLIAFCFFAATANAQSDDSIDSPCANYAAENVFDSLTKAFASPAKVKCLNPNFTEKELDMKALPAKFGTLTNLEVFSFGCLEKLTTLPASIGNLTKMRELIIDNGNGCAMSISVPASIGKLQNLRVLRLFGAIASAPNLPASIGQLRNLEVLDLGRNGLTSVPPFVATLSNLKTLRLDYCQIKTVPAFVGDLKNLENFSLNANENIKTLPASLGKIKGLHVSLGNNALKLRDQKALQTKFPNITFSFENEYDDDRANEEAKK